MISRRSDTLYIYKSELYATNDYSPKVARVKHVMDSIYYLKEYNYEEDLIHEGYYKMVFPKIKHGITIDFYNDGTKRAESMYKNNLIQWSEKWLLNGEKGMDNVYSVVEEEPAYKNKSIREFRNFIMNELILRYDDKGIDGIIIIEFVIMEDGSLKEIQILQSNSEVMANEVVNLITATNGHWSSGKINGKKVRVIKQFPISFISMSK
ncbi:energy transducer TonB [Bacteroidota bacterium]